MKIQDLMEGSNWSASDITEFLNDLLGDMQPNAEKIQPNELTSKIVKDWNAEMVDVDAEKEYGENEDAVEDMRFGVAEELLVTLRPETK